MQRLLWLTSLLALGLVPACVASGTGGPGSDQRPGPDRSAGSPAKSLTLGEPAFHDPQVIVRKSMPPQFVVLLHRDMPTPGWRFEMDELQIDPVENRIVAKLTEVGPTGIVSQVITREQCRIDLGSVQTGKYLLEVWLRRKEAGEHRLAQAFVVTAR